MSAVSRSLLLTVVVNTAGAGGAAGTARADKPAVRAEKGERELPVPALFGRVSPSIVIVEVAHGDEHVQGSGVVIGPGQVVTNEHVVSGARNVEVRQGGSKWTATVEALESKHDLALLSLKNFDLPRVSMRPSSALVVGERVYAVGAPRGLELTLSDGLISALRRDKPEKGAQVPADDGPALIQTSVPISPGSSGGGLFDAQGRLIGITTFSAVASQNLNFAHPTEWIEALRAPKVAGGSDRGPEKVAARSEPRFTLTQRPAALRCRIDTRAVWGLFTGGAEMLESKHAKVDIEITRFGSQTPAFNGAFSGEMPFGDLVLADMSREAGFLLFTGMEGSKGGSQYFFSLDDDGRFRLMLLKGFDFHGQLRVLASSGPCETLEPVKPSPLVVNAQSEDRCARGDIDACVAAGSVAEKTNRTTALSLYLRGCDQGRADDRVARAAAVTRSCAEAARLCDVLGFRSRAAELRGRIQQRNQGAATDTE
jgi:hypothetical protein